MSQNSPTLEISPIGLSLQLRLLVAEIPVPFAQKLKAAAKAVPPISPDTSLPWSQDYALDGWSARMFLHQIMSISMQHWQPSDTERLLSAWIPLKLLAKVGKGISLSAIIKPPGQASSISFRTPTMVRGLLRRTLKQRKSFRLLLLAERLTIPVIVIFTKPDDYASWMVTSAKPLPVSLRDGLLDFLKQHAPFFTAMP